MERKLPPLNPIRAFEAAARHLSFTLAAKELNVSQVAVSRQVHVLEKYLEVTLFERGARSVELTPEGARLLPSLTQAFADIEKAVSLVNMRGRKNVVAIQAYTTFAQWWLIPRMGEFHKAFPDIEVRLAASLEEVNFSRQNLDAVIASKPSASEANTSEFLLPCHLLPVCIPSLLTNLPAKLGPSDVRRFTLLHSLSRQEAWDEWLKSAGCSDVRTNRGLKFESSAMALEAALGGMGVAMGIFELVQKHLKSGQLIAPFGHIHESQRGYYVVRPADRPISKALQIFLNWLTEQARRSREEGATMLANLSAVAST